MERAVEMKQPYKHCVAFDCGNSSLRVVSGLYDGERVELSLIRQIEHSEIELGGVYYWDILFIFDQLQQGLREAFEKHGKIDSCGICTWGIDFGILGGQGQLLGNPLCYRNGMSARIIAGLGEEEKRRAFFDTGVQVHPMNTLYQLAAYQADFPAQYGAVEKLLLIPDLLAYFFTGRMAAERCIASTTQYYDVQSRDYAGGILNRHQIKRNILAGFIEHGQVIGDILPEIRDRLQINAFPFLCVPSHDTACAVAAVPAAGQDFLFISSGTWSLIGTELDTPQIDNRIYESGLANEAGAYNNTTLLKNSAGMYIAQRVRAELRQQGESYNWAELVDLAKTASQPELLFNVGHPSLFAPTSMIKALRELLGATGQNGDCDTGSLLRGFYNSMALSYRQVLEEIERVTGQTYRQIHIIGGGSKNAFLNQLAANATGRTVVAGPVEATSLGNICVQIVGQSADAKEALAVARRVSTASSSTETFEPQGNMDALYQQYLNL